MPPRFTRYACPLCGYAVSVRGKTVTVTHPCPKRSKRGTRCTMRITHSARSPSSCWLPRPVAATTGQTDASRSTVARWSIHCHRSSRQNASVGSTGTKPPFTTSTSARRIASRDG